jgi:periplasmic protein TonB
MVVGLSHFAGHILFSGEASLSRQNASNLLKGMEMYGVRNSLWLEKGLTSRGQDQDQVHSLQNPRVPGKKGNFDLTEGMLEFNRMKKPRTWLDTLASVVAHSLILAALILVPLFYTHAIELPKFETTFLTAPAPPPPPPSPAAVVRPAPKSVLFHAGKLYAPKVIPKHVAMIKDEAEPQQIAGVPGGVIGGVQGGQVGGVLGGILGGRNTMVAPPRKPVVPKGPIRVGGNIQAPQLIRKVQPRYPPLAMETRTQGDVVIDCVLDPHGNVTQMKEVSGPPLLIQAAMQAVSQWKYRPTLLNGQPVSVEMMVTVHFQMDQ